MRWAISHNYLILMNKTHRRGPVPNFKARIQAAEEHLRDWNPRQGKPISGWSERREIPPKGTPPDGQNKEILE
jgi:hypothetical protein